MILFQDGKVSSSQNTKNNKNTTAPAVQLPLFPEFPDTQISAQNTNQVFEFQKCGRSIIMPAHHEVLAQDVDLKRLGGVLATAYQAQPQDFESLMLTPGLGPRTLQSLTLVI